MPTHLAWLEKLVSHVEVPDGVAPVRGFDVRKYMGRWHEIARLEHWFERGLSRCTAEYSLAENGGVNVVNRGYDAAKNRWREARGRAYFIGAPDVGHLKVSFFGPFYGSYAILDLDDDYSHSMVCGPDKSYLWILARNPETESKTVERMLDRAKHLQFATDQLIRGGSK